MVESESGELGENTAAVGVFSEAPHFPWQHITSPSPLSPPLPLPSLRGFTTPLYGTIIIILVTPWRQFLHSA